MAMAPSCRRRRSLLGLSVGHVSTLDVEYTVEVVYVDVLKETYEVPLVVTVTVLGNAGRRLSQYADADDTHAVPELESLFFTRGHLV